MEKPNPLMRRVLKLVAMAISVWFAAWILPGIEVASFWTALWVGVVLGLFNVVLKPILTVISFPLILITFGLFLLIINAVLLSLASDLISGFTVETFWDAIWGSIIISIISALLEPKDPPRVPPDGTPLIVNERGRR